MYTGCRQTHTKRHKNNNDKVGQLGLNSNAYTKKVCFELKRVHERADLISSGPTWEGVPCAQNSLLLSHFLRCTQATPRSVCNLKVSSGGFHPRADLLSSGAPSPLQACSAHVRLPTGASYRESACFTKYSEWIDFPQAGTVAPPSPSKATVDKAAKPKVRTPLSPPWQHLHMLVPGKAGSMYCAEPFWTRSIDPWEADDQEL